MTHIRIINAGMFGLLLLAAGNASCSSTGSSAGPEPRTVGVVVDGASKALGATLGFYMASSDTTTVSGANGAGYPAISLRFPGNKTGTFTCSVTKTGIDYTPVFGTTYIAGAGGDCTITVTSYGAVGESIAGTFSGTVKSGANSVTLTEGGFNVIRQKGL